MSQLFSNRPPERKHAVNFPVIRSGKKWGLEITGLCLSDRVICAPTHFAGRTKLCMSHLGQECPSCAQGWEPRWVGYIAILHKQRQVKGMLDLTERAAVEAADFAEKQGSLRGWIIHVKRHNDRPNGQLQVQFKHSGLELDQVPPGFSLPEALCRMWRIQLDKFEEQRPTIPIEELQARGQLDEDVYIGKERAS